MITYRPISFKSYDFINNINLMISLIISLKNKDNMNKEIIVFPKMKKVCVCKTYKTTPTYSQHDIRPRCNKPAMFAPFEQYEPFQSTSSAKKISVNNLNSSAEKSKSSKPKSSKPKSSKPKSSKPKSAKPKSSKPKSSKQESLSRRYS